MSEFVHSKMGSTKKKKSWITTYSSNNNLNMIVLFHQITWVSSTKSSWNSSSLLDILCSAFNHLKPHHIVQSYATGSFERIMFFFIYPTLEIHVPQRKFVFQITNKNYKIIRHNNSSSNAFPMPKSKQKQEGQSKQSSALMVLSYSQYKGFSMHGMALQNIKGSVCMVWLFRI